MSKTAFERYAPFIQQYIYRKRWTDLREVQVEACEAILDSNNHVIIASGTASGKTEAAFFPILTQLAEHPPQSISVMYIGPLKALINDQFNRLSELLSESDIPVWPWHGDVSQTIKMRALREARGILQITPESLEAMLMRHPGDAVRLFNDLRFVVIDEIHALMGTDRGLQVICLLTRLERLINRMPRRIGLSATLNDYAAAIEYLSSGTDRKAVAVGIRAHKRTIGLHVESYRLPENEEQAQSVTDQYNQRLYDVCHKQKCLIFTNSRSSAETAIADMKEIAHERGEPDVFHVHHGSISASMRHETESALKESEGPTVAAATLTLELGIDIGDLDSTIQLGAPHSCSSFVQRLGRSGRRTGKSQMMFLDLHAQTHGCVIEQLPWSLLQSIAIIQLYLEERWVEPFVMKKKPFSLLIHQTLSILMASGEMLPSDLARKVLTLPAFQDRILLEEYRLLLQYLIQEDILLRMDDGGVIVGNKGEKLTNHYSFYAVFQDENGWHVFYRDAEIGTLDNCPKQDEVFTLSGRCWKVADIDEERRNIFAVPAKTRRIISWHGSGGEIHSKVAQRIKKILHENAQYPYLGENAISYLAEARKLSQESGILERGYHFEGKTVILMPWCGTKILHSIAILLKGLLQEKLQVNQVILGRYHLEIRSGLDGADFISELKKQVHNTSINTEGLLRTLTPAPIDKYDELLPEKLLKRSYVQNELDMEEAIHVLRTLC